MGLRASLELRTRPARLAASRRAVESKRRVASFARPGRTSLDFAEASLPTWRRREQGGRRTSKRDDPINRWSEAAEPGSLYTPVTDKDSSSWPLTRFAPPTLDANTVERMSTLCDLIENGRDREEADPYLEEWNSMAYRTYEKHVQC